MKFKNIFDRYSGQINNLQAPGLPANLVAIFVKGGENMEVYTESGVFRGTETDAYINGALIPWSFIRGLYCSGMNHGSFATERSYEDAKVVAEKTEDDYSVNKDVLNYTFACIAESHSRFYHPDKSGITMVFYCGESDTCMVTEFKDEEEFIEYIAEDLTQLEEYAPEDEDDMMDLDYVEEKEEK